MDAEVRGVSASGTKVHVLYFGGYEKNGAVVEGCPPGCGFSQAKLREKDVAGQSHALYIARSFAGTLLIYASSKRH